MGRTFRKNDFRRPKKDRSGNKSRKLREYEGEKFKFRPPSNQDSLEVPEPPEFSDEP
jgi:hypothetical protein